jgi:hypothetical protein
MCTGRRFVLMGTMRTIRMRALPTDFTGRAGLRMESLSARVRGFMGSDTSLWAGRFSGAGSGLGALTSVGSLGVGLKGVISRDAVWAGDSAEVGSTADIGEVIRVSLCGAGILARPFCAMRTMGLGHRSPLSGTPALLCTLSAKDLCECKEAERSVRPTQPSKKFPPKGTQMRPRYITKAAGVFP